MTDLIHIERRGPVEVWTLSRPDRLNALPDLQDGDAFAAACEAVNADMAVRCVVLTGAGRAFSAGGDLTAMRTSATCSQGSGAEIRERYRRVVHRIVRSLYGLEVPLVAAVNGPAMGLGCDIAGLADIRIASETRLVRRALPEAGHPAGRRRGLADAAQRRLCAGRRDAVHRPRAGRGDGAGLGSGQPGRARRIV